MKKSSKGKQRKLVGTKQASIRVSEDEEFAPRSSYHGANPSEITDVYWLRAERKKGSYPDPSQRAGKWLIFVPLAAVDEAWRKIKRATEEGKLGGSSKVGTAQPNPNATNRNSRVICVYSYDWKDEEDVRRVRKELRKLGITDRIPYKSDEDTLSGKYRVTGHTRISKYFE